MTPRQLNSFLRIAELRSFTKAAVLRIAQPALSRQIQQLATGRWPGVTLLQPSGMGSMPI